MMHRFFDPRSVAEKNYKDVSCVILINRTKKRYTVSMEKEHFISIIKNFVLSFSVVGFFPFFVTLVFFTILDFFGVLSSSLLLSLPIIFIIFSFIAIWLNKIYWEFMNEIQKKTRSRIWSCKRKWLSNWKWIHRFINAHFNFDNRIYHFSIKKFSKWLKRALAIWFRALTMWFRALTMPSEVFTTVNLPIENSHSTLIIGIISTEKQ